MMHANDNIGSRYCEETGTAWVLMTEQQIPFQDTISATLCIDYMVYFCLHNFMDFKEFEQCIKARMEIVKHVRSQQPSCA